jgi:hypothetical protein
MNKLTYKKYFKNSQKGYYFILSMFIKNNNEYCNNCILCFKRVIYIQLSLEFTIIKCKISRCTHILPNKLELMRIAINQFKPQLSLISKS